ncbi:MAG: M23 family metallopeptidase [Deltaproteobacteria bacterium]|nr:M23 family metallopeptidase [Deltaproteobacteria bacterium]
MRLRVAAVLSPFALALALSGGSAAGQPGAPGTPEASVIQETHEEAPASAPPRPRAPAPRRVASPRGADLRRVRRLGLGTRAVAQTLLFDRPRPAWVAAARGSIPRRFLWPVEGAVLTQGFRAAGGRHRALDLGARCGTPVRAAAGGLVGYADNGLGNMGHAMVVIHPGGWVTAYGHLRRIVAPAGALVRRGQLLAEVGDTGDAHGCHLHFILYRNGTRLDPEPRMTGRPNVLRGPRATAPAPRTRR